MQPVTITLNGREVSGHPEMTILDLAGEAGVTIPTLCHEPHLTSIGACRICLVENEHTGTLIASCVTPIAPGMMIHTHSPRVIEHRKNIVKLILASHPDSCLVCDKGNRCKLRQIASDMAIGWVEFQRIHQVAAIEEVNPFIERDISKCLLCAKCIRACQELVVIGAIDYFSRGFGNIPATLNNAPLEDSECTFCGTCVALCPTGALMEKERPYSGTTRTTVRTICPFCGCGCPLSLEVKDNRIVRVLPGGADGEGATHSTLCVRGSYGYDFVHSPERLTKPLLKVKDSFVEVSWDEALGHAAIRLNQIKGEHGPRSLAVFGSSKCTNEENYLLQRFVRSSLGSNNIDTGSRLYNPATRLGLGSAIGFSGTTNYIGNLEQAETIMVVGANPSSSAPIVEYAIKRAVRLRGAKLIVIDPRQTRLLPFAHLWLRPKIGTDVALLNSLAKLIVDEGLLDEEFVNRRTDNFQAVSRVLERYSPEYAQAVTGIPMVELRAAARLYARASGAAIVYGAGITQYANGVERVQAIANLALLTGNIGRRGGGIYALQKENNGQGACDMGALPDFLPGYQPVADPQTRRRLEELWQVSLPAEPGLTAVEMIEQAKEGGIKGLYIVGENPVLSFPHGSLVARALTSLNFLVVQDMFLTETAKLAEVILPAASFAEKEGTFTNHEGRIQRVRKAIEPLGECLPDGEIILRLAEKMGKPLACSSLEKVMDEIEKTVPFYEGYIDFEMLRQVEPEAWQPRHNYVKQFLSGFARFSPVEYIPLPEEAEEDYPFTLMTGRILFYFGAGTRSSRASRAKKFLPGAFVEIGASDAQRLGINDADKIKLISPVGESITGVRITDNLPAGTVFLPGSFSENPIPNLFPLILDPTTKTPLQKACKVRIERIRFDG